MGLTKEVASFLRIPHASEDQQEFIHDGERWMSNPNDDAYQQYAAVMAESDLPYLEADPRFSTEEEIVGSFSRDCRVLPQYAFSMQPTHVSNILQGESLIKGIVNSNYTAYMIGQTLKQIREKADALPAPEDFFIERALINRGEMKVILLPKMTFVEGSEQVVQEILEKTEQDLVPYKDFGGVTLLRALEDGLRD